MIDREFEALSEAYQAKTPIETEHYKFRKGRFTPPVMPDSDCFFNGTYQIEETQHKSGKWHTKITLSVLICAGSREFSFDEGYTNDARPLGVLIDEFCETLKVLSAVL